MRLNYKTHTQLAIVILCIIGFFPVFKANFINYDDPEYVLNNPYIKHFSFENIKHIFLGQISDLYVPLTFFSYLIEYYFFGESAKVFHSVNLLLHIINALLLLQILIKLNIKQPYTIYLILLFFTLNPLITESVCWITERKDVLYTLFYFLSIIQFLNYQANKQFKNVLLCLLYFILACLSKPMAISLPILFTLFIIYTSQNIKIKQFTFLLPFYIISVLSSIVTICFMSHGNSSSASINTNQYHFFEKTLIILSEIGYYFLKPFTPFNQSLFHFFPEQNQVLQNTSIIIYALCAMVLFVVIGNFTFNKKHKLIGFLFVSWLVFLLPILQIYSNTHSYVSERYFYISIIFPISMVYIFLNLYANKLINNKYLLVCLILVFTTLTFKRSAVWKNTVTLFEQELKINPTNHYALNNLGIYYNFKQEFYKALPYLQKAVAVKNTNAIYLNNYGWALSKTGQADSAMHYFEKALVYDANYTDALSNIGISYIQKKQRDKALFYFKKAYNVSPNNKDVLYNLGICYFNAGLKQEALPLLQKAESLGNIKATKYLNKY